MNRSFTAVPLHRPMVNLGQGGTPLIESVHIGPSLGLERLYFKLENCNPSGSYKDRFVASELAHLLRKGISDCVATSSGNTGAALAAGCARYGVACAIVVSETTPVGKLQQMLAHGAQVFRVRGFVASAEITKSVYATLDDLARHHDLPLIVSAYRYCPEGMAGVELISEEITEQVAGPVHHVFAPVGGGGLFHAVCKGFERQGVSPCVHVVQPSGCSTVVAAFEQSRTTITPVDSKTAISGLSVPFDIDASLALQSLEQSGGHAFAVEDSAIFGTQRVLLRKEGIFCEPAGAVATAALSRAVQLGIVRSSQVIVCLITGHGFKDPDSIRSAAGPFSPELIDSHQLSGLLARAR